MARKSEEVFNSLVNIKEGDNNLDGLTSTSETSLWRNQLGVFAAAISFFEQILDMFKSDIIYQKDTTSVYTSQYWKDRVVNFYQHLL